MHAVAFNNTFITGDASVLTLRYGQTYFNDSVINPEYGIDQIRSELGIQGGFLDQIFAQDGYVGQFPLHQRRQLRRRRLDPRFVVQHGCAVDLA